MINLSCSIAEKTTTATKNQLDQNNLIQNHVKENYNDNNNSDNDGFILVKSKKSINNKHKKQINNKSTETSLYLSCNAKTMNLNDIEKCADDLYNKIDKIKYKLKNEDEFNYYSKLIIIFEKILNDFYSNKIRKNMNIICYGLGSIDDNLSSRYQLALLILLIEDIELHLKIKVNLVEFYDPIFSQIDMYLLTKKFNFQVESENLKCMKQIKDDENFLTMFYMPHCGKALYNNLLYSNWSIEKLKNLLIFGNSFTTIRTQTLNNLMDTYYTYINDSYLFLNEIRLCNMKCDLTNDSFYDLSLHLFNVLDYFSSNINYNKNSVIFSSSQNENGGSIKNELVNHLSLSYEADKLNKPVYDNLSDVELI